ncbi:copper resistance CopC family protein [Amycolatopsis sp. EV170708-02-1]|uniref:copper resistance CopC family protein n=1 Tax=Amycolatopsis sp. EV170708-02-1 TaxID=2919322 RepID=UPI001F0BBB4D|nr:copper resistance CopC family protein [Amycolatopsis sp. EV170708-02-1]UMP05890.1 copper resistance protein CopC [Amycolatopsis sp. EV170708-02-1]
MPLFPPLVRNVPRGAALATTVLFLALACAQPAMAHSVLVSSDPAKDSSLASAPAAVTLVFNEPLDSGFTELTVLGPDGTSHWEGGKPVITGEKLSAPLRALGAAGVYTVRYRVVSADGHPVSGSVPFTLTTAGPGTAAAPKVRTDTAAALPPSDDSLPVWPWIAGSALVALAGVFVARRIAKP